MTLVLHLINLHKDDTQNKISAYLQQETTIRRLELLYNLIGSGRFPCPLTTPRGFPLAAHNHVLPPMEDGPPSFVAQSCCVGHLSAERGDVLHTTDGTHMRLGRCHWVVRLLWLT